MAERYRVILVYDVERDGFVARIPEIGEEVFGADRAQALAAAEKKIEEVVRAAAEKGEPLPAPLDVAEHSGELKLQVSSGLHRELEFMAKDQGISLEQLCAELLALATGGGRPSRPAGKEKPAEAGGRPPRRPYAGSRNYFNIMDDKASFLEYVRTLETGGARGPRRGGRGR